MPAHHSLNEVTSRAARAECVVKSAVGNARFAVRDDIIDIPIE